MTDAGVVQSVAAPAVEAVKAAAPVAAQAAQQTSFVWWLVLVGAFTLLFAIELFRALPWSEKAKAARPISCDACMVSWGSVALAALYVWQLSGVMALFHVPCTAGVTIMLFALLRHWKSTELIPPAG